MGLFKNNIRRNTNLITTKHLLFDFDALTAEQLKQKTEELKKDKTVFVMFISPSGDGLKVIYQLDKEIRIMLDFLISTNTMLQSLASI